MNYYDVIVEIINLGIKDGFTAQEIRDQLTTGENFGLMGINQKIESMNNTFDKTLIKWYSMEIEATINAINDTIPVCEVVTGEAVYNNKKCSFSYLNNYKYYLIKKEDGYTKYNLKKDIFSQENFQVNNKTVKSFITDYKYLYNVVC